MMPRSRYCAGFTLIEAIMVIVITGILAGIVAVFITKPVEGYVDSVRRAELTDAADVALRRIARDVRLALPNSLRTVPNGFEFIMTKSGGRYRDASDGSIGGNILNFASSSTDFDVLGILPDMVVGDHVVVYNLGAGYAPADAYDCSATPPGCNRAVVDSFLAANTVRLTSNVFAAQSPPLPSPSARFQVVDQNDLVVRYVCDGTSLTRFRACSLATPSACAAPGAQLAGSDATCTIDYASSATGRNGLLYISLRLTSGGESVTLFQQIHVDNSP